MDERSEPLRKFAVTSLWSSLSALPSLVLHALEVPMIEGHDAGALILSGLWFLCGALTSPALVRILGAVPVVRALPPAGPRLDHLPPACAVLVREAATIRGQLDAVRLEEALQRAWELANAIDRIADPEVRALLEQCGATLQPVRQLVAAHANSAAPVDQLRARLGAALMTFERALEAPQTRPFR